MNHKSAIGLLLVLGGALLVGMSHANAYASEGPIISQSFASGELMPGGTWKIYLKASGGEANMKYLYSTVEQSGGSPYPLSLTRIKGDTRKALSGYFYLPTFSAGVPIDYVILRLVVQIQDDKGRFSEPVVFPLTFKARAFVKQPPEGVFEEKELGPIMIRLRPVGEDGKSFDD